MKEKMKLTGLFLWKNLGEVLSIGVTILSNFFITYSLLLKELLGWVGEGSEWLRYVVISLALIITIIEVWAIASKRGVTHLDEIKKELEGQYKQKLNAMSEEERNAFLKQIKELQDKAKEIKEYIEQKKAKTEAIFPSLEDIIDLDQKEEELKTIENQIKQLIS